MSTDDEVVRLRKLLNAAHNNNKRRRIRSRLASLVGTPTRRGPAPAPKLPRFP